jgi:hypothetical protein
MKDNLRHYRAVIRATDWYEVDVIAPNAELARARAECIDAEYLRRTNGEWEIDEVTPLPPDEFDPPDLPASSWIVD